MVAVRERHSLLLTQRAEIVDYYVEIAARAHTRSIAVHIADIYMQTLLVISYNVVPYIYSITCIHIQCAQYIHMESLFAFTTSSIPASVCFKQQACMRAMHIERYRYFIRVRVVLRPAGSRLRPNQKLYEGQ